MSLSQYKVLFFAIVVLILAFSDKGQISGDGLARWNALVTLMEDGKLTRDKYSMIQPLFAIPLYVVGEFWARFSLDGPTRGDSDAVDKENRIGVIRNVVKRFNKFVVLLISILFYHILQNFYGFDRTQASLGTLFLLFGSLLIPNARDFYSECLGSLLTLFALVSLSTYFRRTGKRTNVRSLFYTVLPIALLIGSTPIALGPVLVLIFYMTRVCVKEQRAGSKLPSMMWPSSPVFLAVFSSLLGIFLFLAENYIRRGALLNFGYVGEGFTTPLLTGLSGLILSPTRGIIFFVPTFLVGFLLLKKKGELPDSGLTLIRFSVIYSVSIILSYSKWHDWHGGGVTDRDTCYHFLFSERCI